MSQSSKQNDYLIIIIDKLINKNEGMDFLTALHAARNYEKCESEE